MVFDSDNPGQFKAAACLIELDKKTWSCQRGAQGGWASKGAKQDGGAARPFSGTGVECAVGVLKDQVCFATQPAVVGFCMSAQFTGECHSDQGPKQINLEAASTW